MKVGILESRAREVLQKALEMAGVEVEVAPVLVEVPEVNLDEIGMMLDEWRKRSPDYFIFLNGSGIQYLFNALKEVNRLEEFLGYVYDAEIILRGPKPASVLQKYNVSKYHIVPSPHTSDLILEHLIAKGVNRKIIVIQHYGEKNIYLSQLLAKAGALVYDISSYRWEIPADIHRIKIFIDRLLSHALDMVIFTSSVQVQHLLTIAEYTGQHTLVVAALNQLQVVSIGPICSQTLFEEGIRITHEVKPPKLFALIEYVTNLQQQKA
ncbi:MAG: uroporphyrinogen-III synthase [Bacteroidales bacterium]